MSDEVSNTNSEMDKIKEFIPRHGKFGGDFIKIIIELAEQNKILKADTEYLLSLDTMKDMGKKILGLREANRSLTRVLAKKDKIITKQSTRITGDQYELAVLRDRACDSYGNIGTNNCEHCTRTVKQWCSVLSEEIKEKARKREAYAKNQKDS